MIAARPKRHSKRSQRYRTMPTAVTSSARAPYSASSRPTCGPTNSTRRSSAEASCSFSTPISFCERSAVDWFFSRCMRISTSREEPKFCTSEDL